MPTQVQSAAEAATPFDPEILVRLSGSLKRVNEGLTPAVGARAAAGGARENVLVVTAPQIKALSLSFTEAAQSAQRGGYPSFSAPFQRVALSLEKMSSGMKGIVDAPRMAGQLTKAGNLHVGGGVVTFVAGFASLFGGNGPDYSGPLSEIHTEIQALRQESQRHFRELAEGLLTHINGLKTTLSHVMENQRIILNAVNQVQDGVDHIKTMLEDHARTTDATLSRLVIRDLIKARGIVERYYDNTTQIQDESVFRSALEVLLDWLINGLKDPMINGTQCSSTTTSESMVEKLNNKSPLNQMGLIAARLRFLFGNDILDEKYTRLPPLEIYQSTAALYLLGTQKSGFYSGDACQRICEDIQNTLQLFMDALTVNPRLLQALFDRYHHHRDRLGRMLWKAPKQIPDALVLDEMEELRCLLMHVATLVGDKFEFAQRVSELDSKHEIIHFVQTGRRPLHAEKAVGPVESYRRDLQWGRKALAEDAWTLEFNTPASLQHHPFQSAVDKLYLNFTQNSPGETLFSTGYKPENRFALWLYKPDPTGYVRPSLPDSFSYVIRRSYQRYGWYKGDTTDEQISDYNYQVPSSQITMPPLSLCTPAMMFIYLFNTRMSPCDIKDSTYERYLIEALLRAPGQGLLPANIAVKSDHRVEYMSERECWVPPVDREYASRKHTTRFTKYFPPNSTFANLLPNGASIYSFKPDPPKEFSALSSFESDDIKTSQAFFKFYTLYASGYLKEAELFLTQHSFNQDHQKSYLLFLVAILGRWDIFEAFEKKYPLNSQYNWIVNGGSLTPLMLAAQHGREDVIEGLLKTNAVAGIDRRSFENKTAAQLAFEQGFYKIAYRLNNGLNFDERVHCRINIFEVTSSVAIANLPNQLALDLAQMKEDVGSLQAAFKSQAESIAQATVAASSAKAAIFVTRSEESDDDKELVLNEITNEELKPPQPLAWCKPRSTQAQEIGKRILPHTFFRNKREELRLTAELERHTFRVTPDIIDGEKCLVTFAKRDILNARA